jgi:2-oxo-4-hydroxy-4-carboxy--5-ureidoimidazoline (OHCU) decarboxylase
MTPAEMDLAAVFERAPGLAERLSSRGLSDPDAIIAAARAELERMGVPEWIAVLNAHPRIGASAGSLSSLSRVEQGPSADAATAAELARLNDAYERTFGFRFVVYVRGRRQEEIVPILRERLARSRDQELATGIDEFLAIARDRLERAAS